MWQFIPETGKRFGLNIGPLAAQSSVDQFDDRFNWEKATPAAAKYIKEIYSTDAQASGLLVMASYNWGEWRVIDYLRKMPANPRQRNFWKFLAQYREQIPLPDLRIRLLDRVGGRDRRKSEIIWIPVRQPARIRAAALGSRAIDPIW